MIYKLCYNATIAVLALFLMVGCKDQKYSVPVPESGLHNDCIKKSVGPAIPGLDVQFMYAMAIKKSEGKLVSAKVEASIPGSPETYLEHRSFHTNPDGGEEVGVTVASPSVTKGPLTEVKFTADTNTATLRYYYVPTKESAGKEVSFTFSVTSSNGQTVSYKMGPYKIRKLDVAKNIILQAEDGTVKPYISIEDMKAYDETEIAGKYDKIDLIYLYRAIEGINFNYALVAPGADPKYRPGITLPEGLNRNTKVQKAWGVRDIDLGANDAKDGAGSSSYIFLDEEDFKTLDISEAPDYALDMKAQSGIWVETADGKYRAYIYVNLIPGTVTPSTPASVGGSKLFKISIKRYAL